MSSISLSSITTQGGANSSFYRSSATQGSTSTSGANTPLNWQTTSVTGKTFGTWSNGGSVWTPGTTGIYMLVWNENSAMTSGNAEFNIMYNTTTVSYGSNSQLATTTLYQGSMVAIFNSVSTSDYVFFSWYNTNNSSTNNTIVNVGSSGRNNLNIMKLTTC